MPSPPCKAIVLHSNKLAVRTNIVEKKTKKLRKLKKITKKTVS
jgi:hypothetical protein